MPNTSENTHLVVLDNKIVESVCLFSLTEKRLIYLLLSEVKNSFRRKLSVKEINNLIPQKETVDVVFVPGEILNSDTWYKLSVRDYADAVNLRLCDAREELKSIVESIRTKAIIIPFGEKGYAKINWVSATMYNAQEDCIGIKWNNDIIPFICNLTEYFVKLKVQQVLQFRSTYSWKLYEVLRLMKGMQVGKGRFKISAEELIKVLDVPESMREFRYFNKKILKPSMAEIRKLDILPKLEVGYVKKGKFIVGLEFWW